jgi:hypothetical protein
VKKARSAKLFLWSQLNVRPTRYITYEARYKYLVGPSELTIVIPPGTTIADWDPAPNVSTGAPLTWANMAEPSGHVRVTVIIPDDLPPGTKLTAAASLRDVTGRYITAKRSITIRASGTSR